MQPDHNTYQSIVRVARKEVSLFFSSPIAYLFLATFSAVTLFIFFWVESFFSRNIADARPMFEWMPILLIFLCATLTMRLWSEERRTGTLEHVLTTAVPLWHFVVGKFIGCLFLLAVALVMTLPIPLTVSFISELDWGPVWAGYLATLLLGSAYLSIGLFVSARSENQIVSLISACALSGFFYLIGTDVVTNLANIKMLEWLEQLATGTRFESITRGVIDARDLYYYLSMTLVFLALNTLTLEKERWAKNPENSHHRQWLVITTLVIANALGANLWLGQLNSLRMDVTKGNLFSISDATINYLNQLQEPLLIRGYFSSKTHPLLAPLVPQLKDLIREYEIAGKGKVRVEFIDPAAEPELEEEANQKYGIKPVPFQISDRYQSSIVSSYFNVLISYAGEYEVLGFRDLIELKVNKDTDLDVRLRNPEHDLTRSIKKVLYSYQSGGNLFDNLNGVLTFNAYVSSDQQLPEKLKEFKQAIGEVLDRHKTQSAGKFAYHFIDPEANNGAIAQKIAQDYGFMPMTTNLLNDKKFYFYLTLTDNQQVVQIPLDDLSAGSFEKNLEAGIKRFSKGFTKTIALVSPPSSPYSVNQSSLSFTKLENYLGSELNVIHEDLSDGQVSGQADLLFLVAPQDLNDKQLFAVDQFLMQGGTVIAATSPYKAELTRNSMSLHVHKSGLEQWLAHNGLTIDNQLVLDPQNTAFPIPVTRRVGNFQLNELRLIDYPYFIDIRADGMNQENPITSELPQLTMTWASPIKVTQTDDEQRQITELIHSSNQSWLSSSLDIMPKFTQRGPVPLQPSGEQKSYLLGVISQGKFTSYFADKPSPLVDEAEASDQQTNDDQTNTPLQLGQVIEHSSDSARIILFSSNDFIDDSILHLAGQGQRTQYTNSLQMIHNAVDWALEDAGLLSIRSRGHFNRTLPPMERSEQALWEYLNYGFALALLLVIALSKRFYRQQTQRRYVELLAS